MGIGRKEKDVLETGQLQYASDIQLGEKYRDGITGVEGTAISLHFYMHACERVTLRTVSPKTGEILEYGFDAAELIRVSDEVQMTAEKTGGPERSLGTRPSPPVR